ncbi:RRP8 [Hepatospora eriocheir]|uniref:Ribosomal RNA-processing protein 8 n=1 Tax=Hepatospora eriocheir TaxID=1081669 RepID=A0A1X0QFI6_9MICR|nr:RRP8 [Hepatospora eriocheir]
MIKKNNLKEKKNFKEALENRLNGSKFRIMNENMSSNQKFSTKDFIKYFEYYEKQIKKWPTTPNKLIYNEINKTKNMVVGDLGCGKTKKINQNHYLYDQFPCSEDVVKADIENIPVENNFFDIVVCSLSIMKNNITKVIKEVNRILKVDGIFYYGELKSRISSCSKLIEKLEKCGFKKEDVNSKQKCFIVFKFRKTNEVLDKLPDIKLDTFKYNK